MYLHLLGQSQHEVLLTDVEPQGGLEAIPIVVSKEQVHGGEPGTGGHHPWQGEGGSTSILNLTCRSENTAPRVTKSAVVLVRREAMEVRASFSYSLAVLGWGGSFVKSIMSHFTCQLSPIR